MLINNKNICEKWLDVVGYEGIYMVSNKGGVRKNNLCGKDKSIVKWNTLLPIRSRDDYNLVSLSKNKQAKIISIHRLVANAFLGYNSNKMQVNHKNGVRNDNRVENLEWCTPKENTRHSYDYLRGRLENRYDDKIDAIDIISDMEGEEWRDMLSYEGLYKISNYGRLKSLARQSKNTDKVRFLKEKLLNVYESNQGYIKANLYNKNKVKRTESIHRLIGIAFISNPENKKEINHKNGIRNDNRIENLEWCTRVENVIHSFKVLNRKRGGGVCLSSLKQVAQYDLEGNFLKMFKSVSDAGRILHIKPKNISACAAKSPQNDKNGKKYIRKTARGFMFRFFIENPLVKIEEYVKVEMVRGKEISVYNLQGELIANFPSTKIASDRLKLSPTCVKRVLMGTQHQHKGYKFKLN